MPRAHLNLFGFPIRFEPVFFLLVGFIAFQGQGDLYFTAIWIAIITASVLIHELGHAFAYRHYGATPSIALHGLGGVTYGHNSGHLQPTERIVVSAAGSITTMVLLGGPAWIALNALELRGDTYTYVNAVFFVNVVWAAINLAPVFPLDGGQIMDDGLLLATGKPQRRIVHIVSIAAAIAICVWAYQTWRSIFALFIFGYFAYMNFAQLRAVGGKPRQPAPSLEDVLRGPQPGRDQRPDSIEPHER